MVRHDPTFEKQEDRSGGGCCCLALVVGTLVLLTIGVYAVLSWLF